MILKKLSFKQKLGPTGAMLVVVKSLIHLNIFVLVLLNDPTNNVIVRMLKHMDNIMQLFYST